jgi:hypothetical protein
MAKNVGHLQLFPSAFPSREITIVVDIIRRNDTEHTLRDQVEACWWVAGYGASMIPDSHPPLAGEKCTEEEMADKLAECCGGGVAGVSALPWALFLPLLIRLAERLIKEWLNS